MRADVWFQVFGFGAALLGIAWLFNPALALLVGGVVMFWSGVREMAGREKRGR